MDRSVDYDSIPWKGGFLRWRQRAIPLGRRDLPDWSYRHGKRFLRSKVPTRDSKEAARSEVIRQLDRFRRLMVREPTHLDSHQHVHTNDPLRSVPLKIAASLPLPVHDFTPAVRHWGHFLGQGKHGLSHSELFSVEALIGILEGLPRRRS